MNSIEVRSQALLHDARSKSLSPGSFRYPDASDGACLTVGAVNAQLPSAGSRPRRVDRPRVWAMSSTAATAAGRAQADDRGRRPLGALAEPAHRSYDQPTRHDRQVETVRLATGVTLAYMQHGDSSGVAVL